MSNKTPAKEPKAVDRSIVNNCIECDNFYYTKTSNLLKDSEKTRTIDTNWKVNVNDVFASKTALTGLWF